MKKILYGIMFVAVFFLVSKFNGIESVYAADTTWQNDYGVAGTGHVYSSSAPYTITLNTYTGTATDVVVPATAEKGGITYTTRLRTYASDTTTLFYNNRATITSVTFQSGVVAQSTSLNCLFSGCTSLISADLSGLDTTTITTTERLFLGCSNLTSINLTGLNTINVGTMYAMFSGCSKLVSVDLSGFNTTNVIYMNHMFKDCSKIASLDLSNFNTAKVTDMSWMFTGCSSLTTLDLSSFNTSKVTTLYTFLYNCTKLTSVNLTSFNTSLVTDMSWMIVGCDNLTTIDLSSFTIGAGTSVGYMLGWSSNLVSITVPCNVTKSVALPQTYIDSSKTLYTNLPLNVLSSFTIVPGYVVTFTGSGDGVIVTDNVPINGSATAPDMSTSTYFNSWNKTFSNITANTTVRAVYNDTSWQPDYSYTLDNTSTPKKIILNRYVGTAANISIPSIAVVDGIEYTTYLCNTTSYSERLFYDKSDVLTSVVFEPGVKAQSNSLLYLFDNCVNLVTVDLSGLDATSATNMSDMFSNCKSMSTITFGSFDTSNVTNMYDTFYNCTVLETLNLSNFNTTNVTNMSYMFERCRSLTSLTINNFDTSNVINMSGMFYNCNKITNLSLTNFNTSKVVNMSSLFENCYLLKSVDMSSFNTSNVTTMAYMFGGCYALEVIDLSNFDVMGVTDMYEMFLNCRSIETLDLSNFYAVSVVNVGSMFCYCEKLSQIDLSNFVSIGITNMSSMFAYSGITSIDLTGVTTDNVTDITSMFENCVNLVTINMLINNLGKCTSATDTFTGCTGLISIKIPTNLTIDVALPTTFYTSSLVAHTTLPKVALHSTEEIKIGYTVDFKNLSGASIESPLQIVRYGEDAVEPTITDSDFMEWDKTFTNITSNLVVQAKGLSYTIEVPNSVSMQYDNVTGYLLGTIEIKLYGKIPVTKQIKVQTQYFDSADFTDAANQIANNIGVFNLTQSNKSPNPVEFKFTNTYEQLISGSDLYAYSSVVTGTDISTSSASPSIVSGTLTLKTPKPGNWNGSLQFTMSCEDIPSGDIVLYNAGDENVAVTGGWDIYKTATDGTSTYTENATNSVLSLNSTPAYGTYYKSANMIDMSEHSYLVFEGSEVNCGSISGKRAIEIGLYTVIPVNGSLGTRLTNVYFSGLGTYVIDVSSINVPVYVVVGGANYPESGQTSIITTTNITLIK